MSLVSRLIWLTLFFATAIFFASQADYVLAVAVAITGIASFGGYRVGAVYILGSLASIAAAVELAPSIGRAQEFRFEQWFGTTGLTNRILSIGTVGVLISFVVSMLVISVAGLFFANRRRMEKTNRWLGFVIGGVQGIAVVLLFLGGLLVLEPIERQRADMRDPLDARGQFVSKWILKITDRTHDSPLGPLIVAYNPFTRIPQLNKVEEIQQSVQVLSDAEKIDRLIHHPSIERLKERPEIRRTIDRLNEDAQVQKILRSGHRIDRAAAMTLLSHPAVLELIDQPVFVEQAYKVIQETQTAE